MFKVYKNEGLFSILYLSIELAVAGVFGQMSVLDKNITLF